MQNNGRFTVLVHAGDDVEPSTLATFDVPVHGHWWPVLQSARDLARTAFSSPAVDAAWVLWEDDDARPVLSLERCVHVPEETELEELWFTEGYPAGSPWDDGPGADDPQDRPGANF